MSTRCNIRVITPHNCEVWLYRHHDGYLSMTGRDIARALDSLLSDDTVNRDKASNMALRFVALLATESGKYGVDACGVYELTSGQHGDIDYLYTVNFMFRDVSLQVDYRKDFDKGPEPIFIGDYWLGYRKLIADATREWWNRIRDYKRRQRAAS